MSEHIVSVRTYIGVFLILMVGTALTVWAGLRDFPGPLNVVIALTIACVKATFVILYFMHVRYSSRLVWVVVCSALFWLAILFVLTFTDYWTRQWLGPSVATLQEREVSYRALQPRARTMDTPTEVSHLTS
jgi:cytochrome c oxidase subunit IV